MSATQEALSSQSRFPEGGGSRPRFYIGSREHGLLWCPLFAVIPEMTFRATFPGLVPPRNCKMYQDGCSSLWFPFFFLLGEECKHPVPRVRCILEAFQARCRFTDCTGEDDRRFTVHKEAVTDVTGNTTNSSSNLEDGPGRHRRRHERL